MLFVTPSPQLSSDYVCVVADKVYVMYHGTSLESAALIESKGFRASDGGLLGPGVEKYVSRNMQETQQYRGSGGVILEVLVRVGRVYHISQHSAPVPVGEKWKA